GRRIARRWRGAASRSDLALVHGLVALVVALRLRAHELHQGLRDAALALRLLLGRRGASGLQAVDEDRERIDLALGALHERVRPRAVGALRRRGVALGTAVLASHVTLLGDVRSSLRLGALH